MSGSGVVLSYKMANSVSAMRVVSPDTAAMTCKLPASANVMPLGITIDDIDQASGVVPVKTTGIADLVFAGSCTMGGFVTFDSAGKGVEFAPASTTTGLTLGTGVVGINVGGVVTTANQVSKVQLAPQFIR